MACEKSSSCCGVLQSCCAYCQHPLLCVSRKPDEEEHRVTGRKRSSPAALQSLVKYLLSLAGKRILVLFALSIARTALSNRLARLQVGPQ